jgi:hypothetical protein
VPHLGRADRLEDGPRTQFVTELRVEDAQPRDRERRPVVLQLRVDEPAGRPVFTRSRHQARVAARGQEEVQHVDRRPTVVDGLGDLSRRQWVDDDLTRASVQRPVMLREALHHRHVRADQDDQHGYAFE